MSARFQVPHEFRDESRGFSFTPVLALTHSGREWLWKPDPVTASHFASLRKTEMKEYATLLRGFPRNIHLYL